MLIFDCLMKTADKNIPESNDFAVWLRKELKAQGITQKQLAQRSNGQISEGQISHILKGKRGYSFKSLSAIATGLHLNFEEVYTHAGDYKSKEVNDPLAEHAKNLVASFRLSSQKKKAVQLLELLYQEEEREINANQDTKETENI